LYLPREFSAVIMTVVYIQPQNKKTKQMINKQENLHPEAAFLVAGDINSASLRHVMPNFQHFSFTTWGDKVLDHCYSTHKQAYNTLPHPHSANQIKFSRSSNRKYL
jgi:hypothetical protein